MDIDTEASASQSYTILRIKRKRNEEPLDALVVESRVRRKKSRGGIGVFQFAQTVEHDVWEDEQRQQAIQDQISRLARGAAVVTETKLNTSLGGPVSPVLVKQQKEDLSRHYTILGADNAVSQRRRHPTSPPKVLSAKNSPPKSVHPDFKMYDAVLAIDKSVPPAVDSEMEKFLPMLNDYLKLHDVTLDSAHRDSSVVVLAPAPTSDDYVWDIFYHRPTTSSEWSQVANVGTLSGLPPSITDPYDSVSDSEEEDEADEDSNAEEYYKNDYPEEDNPSDSEGSDEFHEGSETEEVYYDDDGDDHEWR
ncbi:hypothetical protein BDZ94DRAFT_1298106 [Collybia nuda]|uniref:Probable RNA polymerase II nuclear localization protein SLC7A6OS n=1 Tax=Collybia nuda TaxID=64659 RepID=A0A9P5Y812_9AGAR|nr:hypothetical protein BDZ94DRAFT_1298106 [Collybia nuda]